MALKDIQPYHDICDVSFSIARIAHSPRKRNTLDDVWNDVMNRAADVAPSPPTHPHMDSEWNNAMNDAANVAIHIFYRVHNDSTVPEEIRALLNTKFGPALNEFQERESSSISSDRPSLPEFSEPIVKRGVEVMLENKGNLTLVEMFINLIHAAYMGKGMMNVLDNIADSIHLEYLDKLTPDERSTSTQRASVEISVESATDDIMDDDPLNSGRLTFSELTSPFDGNGNPIPGVRKETIQFSTNSETSSCSLEHIVKIHWHFTGITPILGVIPYGYVRRRNINRFANNQTSNDQEASSQPSQQNDQQVADENVSVSNENDSTQPEAGRPSVESDSNHVVLNFTENDAGSQAEQRSGTEAQPDNTTTPENAIPSVVADFIREQMEQTQNNATPSNSSHLTLIRRRATESDSFPPNSIVPTSIRSREVASNSNQTPPNQNRNSSNPNVATTQPELVRPWTKLVAVLNPSEPVPIDSAIVFTYKHLHKNDAGHVTKTGLISGLVGHERAFKVAKVQEQLSHLCHDQVGASMQLRWTARFSAFLYMAGTFVLAVLGAALNVGKRKSWYAQATDFVSILTLFWVTIFGIIKLVVDDPDVLRNLALGKWVFRTAEQVYKYAGDATDHALFVKTAIAMNCDTVPWASEVDMSFARSTLNGKIELRNGLTATECQMAGWVFGNYTAYDICRERLYRTTFENGRHTIDMSQSFGFPGLQNLIFHHFKSSVFV